eukprot:scaffold11400_cov134-Isochrysis_galbana.AAC.8
MRGHDAPHAHPRATLCTPRPCRPQRPARRRAPAPPCAGTQSSPPMPRGLARAQAPGPPCRSPGAPAGDGASEIATVRRRAHLQSPPPCSRRIPLYLHGRDLVILVGRPGGKSACQNGCTCGGTRAAREVRFELNAVNQSHTALPAYPIQRARRAMNSRLWCSASSGSFRSPGPWHVYLYDRKRRRACDGSSPSGLIGPVEPLPARFRGVLVASDQAGHKAVLAAGRHFTASVKLLDLCRAPVKTEPLNNPTGHLFTKALRFHDIETKRDIAELYITPSWDEPTHDQDNTTESDKGILKELRKYYSWLYSEKPSLENEAPLKTLKDKPLQASDIELMERPVTLHECRQAIHHRHDRKCLEGSLNMTRGHTIKHRHTAV